MAAGGAQGSSGGGGAGGTDGDSGDDAGESLAALKRKLSDAGARVSEALRVADPEALRAALAAKENEAAGDGVWSDAAAGQRLMAEIGDLRAELGQLEG